MCSKVYLEPEVDTSTDANEDKLYTSSTPSGDSTNSSLLEESDSLTLSLLNKLRAPKLSELAGKEKFL